MKKIIFTLALIFAVTVVSAQDNPFEKFTDMDGVTSVFISKNMIALFPKDSNLFGGVSINSFVDKLSSILILTTENKKVGQEMLSLANSRIKTNNYELLMRVKSDDGENVNFYMKGKPENIQELIMIVDGDDDESVIMQFLGNFKLEDVQNMTKEFKKQNNMQ
jgi:fumarate reductase subunit C